MLCECGCGEKTKLAPRTHTRLGHIKGQPLRFIPGHQNSRTPVLYVEEDRGYKTPCWIWQLALDRDGYGKIRRRGTKTRRAARAFFEDKHGPLGAQVPDHLCRVRCCVNPDHMEAVSNKLNSRRRSDAKLGYEEAATIRALDGRMMRKDIAVRFGVSRATITYVMQGKLWQ